MYNLGTGQGVSVLQLVKTFERVTGTAIPYKIVERREGDISVMYANAELAERELEWKSKHTLEEMCKKKQRPRVRFICDCFIAGVDFWRWQTMNPDGYRTKSTKMTNGHR